MKESRKILLAILSAGLIASAAIAFSSCGNSAEENENVTASHVTTYTAAERATCQKEGHIGYWYCDACKQYFYYEHTFWWLPGDENSDLGPQDVEQEYSIKKEDLVTQKTPHDYGADGKCKMCGETGSYSPSEGLSFTLLEDGTYSLTGLGTCKDEVIVVPSAYNSLPVSTIGMLSQTENTNVKSVIISEGITKIEDNAFSSSIEKTVESIFLPDSLEEVGENAFYYCYRALIKENGVKYIDDWAVNHASDEKLVLRSDTVGIAAGACRQGDFGNKFTIPDSVKHICDGAFEYAEINSLTISGNVEKIGYEAFKNCDARIITLNEGVKVISEDAFRNCTKLLNLTLPESLEEIDKGAFANCDSLVLLTLPAGVKKIGPEAFINCAIAYVEFKNTEGWTTAIDKLNAGVWSVKTDVIAAEDLTDPITATKLLCETHAHSTWTRE